MVNTGGRWRKLRRDRDNACVGMTMSGLKCANAGTKRTDGQFWCNQHVVQMVSTLIAAENQ